MKDATISYALFALVYGTEDDLINQSEQNILAYTDDFTGDPTSSEYQEITFLFSTPVSLSAGQTYYIVVLFDDPATADVQYFSSDSYDGGQAYINGATSSGKDMNFSTNIVETINWEEASPESMESRLLSISLRYLDAASALRKSFTSKAS